MVARYISNNAGEMEEYAHGGYVLLEDYQDLEDKLTDAEIELKLLKDKITDLFREM